MNVVDFLAKIVAKVVGPVYYAKKRIDKKRSYRWNFGSNSSFIEKAKDFLFDNLKIELVIFSGVIVVLIMVFSFNNLIENVPNSLANETTGALNQSNNVKVKEELENKDKEKLVNDSKEEINLEKPELAQMNEFEKSLRSKVEENMLVAYKGSSILVNGNSVGFFKTEEEANSLIEELNKIYKEPEKTYKRVFFKEEVEVVPSSRPLANWEGYGDVENCLKYIVKGTDEEKIHEVQKGENFWVIAKYYNVGVDDLIKANPKAIPERLQIGQKISLIVPKPLITVSTVESAEYAEAIPFDIKYEDSGSYYKGEFRTKKNGVKGERKVLAEVYSENGLEVGRLIMEEDIISEPTTKIMYRGTKNPPPRKGTGVFGKPLSRGYVTSEFGWRWGRRHNGIDIGVPIGTPVTAADGGVVIFSGTQSSYGKVVKIDHGANLISIYAHNSKLYVKKGDKVFKGQTISASGNTGVSTGPHLHFEIRKNGTPINPRTYLKF